ncbi:sigma-70 family RNA polymerase sigma factor [Micromonospora sp. DT233]|uniref:sigma-70 family RNA polymerase sigma factor n=1 Tax=Micromonospora sp. DT233 TaxID=3393432 RepID=UPI003CF4D9A3
MEEWTLVRRAQAGDQDAFARLYLDNKPLVMRYIARRVGGGDQGLVEDLTSETFCRAYRALDRYTEPRQRFVAWLSTIASRLILDHAKAHRTRYETPLGLTYDYTLLAGADETSSAEAAVLRKYDLQHALAPLLLLRPAQRETLLARFWAGGDKTKMAQALGTTTAAAKSRQRRAVRKLEGLRSVEVRLRQWHPTNPAPQPPRTRSHPPLTTETGDRTPQPATDDRDPTSEPGPRPVVGSGLPPLRGYQWEAVEAITAGLGGGGRGQVVAACGTGKTLLALHAAVRLAPAGLVVVAVPSLALLAQTLRAWTTTSAAATVLAVCGDDTVAASTPGARNLPCPVTTDPHQVAAWVRRNATAGMRLIAVTHQSAPVLGAGLTAARTAADLLVVDEAHRTTGIAGRQRTLLHNDTVLPARRRLYLTATPRLPAGGAAGTTTLSMDDPHVFGPRLYTYPFYRAIDEGWLDDYRILVLAVTRADLLRQLRHTATTPAVLDQTGTRLRTALAQIALVKAAAEYGLRRVIAFCPRIAESAEFTRTLPATTASLPTGQRPPGPLTALHVDATHPSADRDAAIRALADPPGGGWTVLSNARCLTEGVDVPAVDTVCFTHPKHSTTDIVQAVGRALRRNPTGPGTATILVPVVLPDHPTGISDTLHEWDTVCQVLRAMRAHDTTLPTALDTHRTPDDRHQPRLPPQVVMRLPDTYSLHDLTRHITVRILERTTSPWWEHHAQLAAFHAHHGHPHPTPSDPDHADLATWLNTQRYLHRTGRLPADRAQALTDLGVDWAPRATHYDRAMAAARAYHAEHGHLNIPFGHLHDGIRLGDWLRAQRRKHRAGTLPTHQVQALHHLGIDWTIGAHTHSDDGLAAAQAFHHTHQRLPTPTDHDRTVNGIDVDSWIKRQRKKRHRGQLTDEQVRALDRLGIVWSLPDDTWNRHLTAARAFAEREGHLRPSHTHRENGLPLGRWLADQRTAQRAGRLTPDKTAALDHIGMDWTHKRRRATSP